MSNDGLIEIEVDLLGTSEGALLVSADGDTETWLPRSLVHESSFTSEPPCSGSIVIPEWLAYEKELI